MIFLLDSDEQQLREAMTVLERIDTNTSDSPRHDAAVAMVHIHTVLSHLEELKLGAAGNEASMLHEAHRRR